MKNNLEIIKVLYYNEFNLNGFATINLIDNKIPTHGDVDTLLKLFLLYVGLYILTVK